MSNGDQYKDKQGEFFNDLSARPKKPWKDRLRLGKIAVSLSYENIFLIAIGSIMLFLTCYSLGVERGKQLAQLKTPEANLKQKRVQKEAQPRSSGEEKEKKVRVELASVKEPAKVSSYIQVASFRTDKHAKEEKERLKSKGYQPYIARWGKYKVVCVGGYKNQDEAARAFRQLRKLYADCILHER